MTQTTTKYFELLKRAEETTSRREAVYLIREAGKLRAKLTHSVDN